MGRGSADATLIAIDICRWHVPKVCMIGRTSATITFESGRGDVTLVYIKYILN